MTTKITTLISIVTLLSIAACDPKMSSPSPCDDTDTTGDTGSDTGTGDPLCPYDLNSVLPVAPLEILALECHQSPADTARVTCSAAMFLAEGHAGDFAIDLPTAAGVAWNELPFDAEAGPWEASDLIGTGFDCGVVAINSATITANSNGDRYFDLVLTDDSLGLYTSQRIWLADDGPLIDL